MHTYIDANSTHAVLNLTRNYNHVFVALENDPSIQYSYKFTGETSLSQWKNTGPEIHLIGLSRGVHELFIRGERNGVISSNVLQYDIFIKTPFYLTWWCISIFIILALLDALVEQILDPENPSDEDDIVRVSSAQIFSLVFL